MNIRLATLLVICASFALGVFGVPAEAATQKQRAKQATTRHKVRVIHRAELQDSDNLLLQSSAVVVLDQSTGAFLFEKNAGAVLPIASITKLMTAMVALDAQLPLNETLTVAESDVDIQRGSRSRLRVGTQLSREDMLRLALMSSENRASSALGRNYPGGMPAFVAAMNAKAEAIGLKDTRFSDSTGLNAANVSSARDLTKMVAAASKYPLIRELSTTPEHQVDVGGHKLSFHNTNLLVRNGAAGWDIALSKTGFINESGKCLVMQAWFANKPIVIVLLDSMGRLTRISDANRIKRWIESAGIPGARPRAAISAGNAG